MNEFEYRVNFLDEEGHLVQSETFVVEAEDNEAAIELIEAELGDEYELEFILRDVR